jgi:hypothetical protein
MFKKKSTKGLHLILICSMVGMGTFSYIPIAFAKSNQQTVTPVAQEQSNTLSKLEIEGIPLNQTFSADVDTYSATIEAEIKSIQLKVETNNPESLITVNDRPVTNGSTSPFLLQTGENTFLINVGDGSHGEKTYTLVITRKQSNSNLLKNINLSKGKLSPKFDPAVTDYSVKVANEVDSIKLTPEAINNKASIQVNNSLFKDYGVSVQLPVGNSDIIILVTAENGDKKTYTIHIARAAEQDNKPTSPTINPIPNANGSIKGYHSKINGNNSMTKSSMTKSSMTKSSISQNSIQQNSGSIKKTSTATLSSLTVSEGTWDSTFSTNEYTYHLAVSSDVMSVKINPSATYNSAAITVEGSTNKTVQLGGNKTVISVVVTRGDDRKTYVLVFDRAVQKTETTTAATLQSTNPNLSSTSSYVTSESTTPTTVAANGQKLGKSTTSTSFWGRLIAFFKKIFN